MSLPFRLRDVNRVMATIHRSSRPRRAGHQVRRGCRARCCFQSTNGEMMDANRQGGAARGSMYSACKCTYVVRRRRNRVVICRLAPLCLMVSHFGQSTSARARQPPEHVSRQSTPHASQGTCKNLLVAQQPHVQLADSRFFRTCIIHRPQLACFTLNIHIAISLLPDSSPRRRFKPVMPSDFPYVKQMTPEGRRAFPSHRLRRTCDPGRTPLVLVACGSCESSFVHTS